MDSIAGSASERMQIGIELRSIKEKYPRWLKGHPWKGCRSLVAARGFKSLLLRSTLKTEQQCSFERKDQTNQKSLINSNGQKTEKPRKRNGSVTVQRKDF